MSGLIYPDLTSVDFAPNALGQPSQAGSFASNVTWFPTGALQGFTYGNGRTHSMTPNVRQLPARSTDPGVLDLGYTYDANGNVTDITDYAQSGLDTRSMTYDPLDRLESATASQRWGLAMYEYDGVDNLRKATVGGAQTVHTIDAYTNRLDALSGAQQIAYQYDTRGNVIQRATRSFTFDAADRIVSTSDDKGDESYLYDGHGRRVRITGADGTKTYPIYSQSGKLLAEQATDGTFTNYVYLSGSLIARTNGSSGGGGNVPPAPIAPTVSPSISTTGHYAVGWSIPAGVTSMELMESANGGTPVSVQPQPAGGAIAWSPSSARVSGSYAYSLRACNANGCSVAGAQGTVYVVRPPTGLTWSPQPLGVNTPYTVSWDGVITAFSYQLQEKIGNSWTNVTSGNNTQWPHSGRPAGSYPYRVKACRNSTCSAFSAEITVQVQAGQCTPAPPASISVTPTNTPTGEFTVTWPASSSSCVTSYQLEELYNGTQWLPVPLTTTQVQQRNWSPDPPKSVSGTYAYRVRACGGGQCSTTMVGAVVTVSIPVSLAVPTGLQVCRVGVGPKPCAAAGSTLFLVGTGTSNYRVSWNAVQDATSYQFQLTSSTANYPNPQLGTPQSVNYLYTDGGGNPMSDGGWLEHSYKIRACAGANCSAWTDPSVTVRIESNPLRPTVASAVYYHTDALGSPVAETNALGMVIKRTAYQPWGAVADGNTVQGPGYTGHVTDALTGLSYMQQRYYDPAAGRFLSIDPVAADPGNFNRYWYANNNPYSNIDPDGRLCMPLLSDAEMCDRSLRYEKLDQDARISNKTRFFGAASMVTNALGTSRWHVSPFMASLSRKLEGTNSQRANMIRNGQLFNTGSIAKNDAAFVHYEQTKVQSELDGFKASDAEGYRQLVADANSALNGPVGDRNFSRAINMAQKEVGGKLDFANQGHREALGRSAAQVVRSTAQYCSGSHIRKC